MEIETKEVNETRREVVITFSGEDIASEEKGILSEFSRHAKIPGFRPGKAPEAMLRKRYGREIAEEINRKVLRSGYEKMQADAGLEILNLVEVKDPDLNGEPPFSMTIVADIKPAFEIPDYKGMALEKESTEVSDGDIDEAVEATRAQRAEFEKVDRAAETGDYVRCSYEGRIDGVPIADQVSDRPMYGTQKNTWEEAGAEDAPGIGEIAAALVGMKEGDTRTVEAAYPDDHEVEFLRGRTVAYDLEVLEVRERKLPELDEAFLKTLNVDSVEKLREQLAETLKADKEQTATGKLREAATRKLGEAVDFPLPESLVAAETNQILSNYMARQMRQGTTAEELEQNREALYAGAGEEARRKVKLDLILDEIAKAEKVEVTEDDMSQFLYSYAMQTRRTPDDIVKELRKDQARVADIQRNIRRSKAVARVVELAETSGTAVES
ncbi:MAG: trigger factor [Puniceicoccaceae bacterium]